MTKWHNVVLISEFHHNCRHHYFSTTVYVCLYSYLCENVQLTSSQKGFCELPSLQWMAVYWQKAKCINIQEPCRPRLSDCVAQNVSVIPGIGFRN